MLHTLFLWFYCLPLPRVFLLVLVASLAYLTVRPYLQQRRFWRLAVILLLLAWLIVIAAATLTDRFPGSSPAQPEWIPFHSYREILAGGNPEILRSNLMNVILFYPAGLLACELFPSGWNRIRKILTAVLLFAAVSTGIEFCQFWYALGRPEIDDVLHNSLGAFTGALVCTTDYKTVRK